MQQLHANVQGRVQGVGFRAATQAEASRLGLTGWVANRWDGSVEVVAEGSDQALRRLERWLQHGPPPAHVERIETDWRAAAGEFQSFRIRH